MHRMGLKQEQKWTGVITIIVVLLSWLIAHPSVIAQTGLEPIVTTDMLKIRLVEQVTLSSDGMLVAASVRSIHATEEPDSSGYEYRSHIHLFRTDQVESAGIQLTRGKRDDTRPEFVPGDRELAFLRTVDGKAQVWLMPLDGGEPRMATDMPNGVRQFVFSPDGRYMVIQSDVPLRDIIAMDGYPEWSLERPGREPVDDQEPRGNSFTPSPDGTKDEISEWLDENAKKGDPIVVHRLDYQDEQALALDMKLSQLFVIDLDMPGSEPVRVTRGAWSHVDPAFMPNTGRIVFASNSGSTSHPDRERSLSLWSMNLDSSGTRKVLSIEDRRLRSPSPSNDGTVIGFIARNTNQAHITHNEIGLVPSDGAGDPLWLTEQVDASVRSFRWTGEGSEILFNSASDGTIGLNRISPSLLKPDVLVADRQVQARTFDTAAGTIAWTASSPGNPSVIMVRDRDGKRTLFDPNRWIAGKQLSMPTQGWVDRPDGSRIQYWLMPPTEMIEGRNYPLVLEVHGGPGLMWGPGDPSMWFEFQLLCSWGYGVVFANPRGSDGYGLSFLAANQGDWGPGPAGDCLAAVDAALESGWVDPDRLLITGGSYGGFLTAWTIAHDHRFKAAVAQRGVYELGTFFGEGNAWRLVEWSFGGYPFESRFRDLMDRNNPFLDARQIRTPLMIMHAENDLRTGVSQSAMLFRALKVLEKPVEYVIYPGAGHDLSRTGDPRQRMDRLDRMIEFFGRFIENRRPAPQALRPG